MYDSKEDTLKHILQVKENITLIILQLSTRAVEHDASKLKTPEKEVFDKVTPLLKDLTYGSDEYKEALKEMGVALDHHYKNNRHHQEHFENGINGMNLVDIVEMFCDWYAATKRHDDGNIYNSLEINKTRFNLSDDLLAIFKNTAESVFNEK